MLLLLMNYFNNECFVAIMLYPYFLNYYSSKLILTKTYFFYYVKIIFFQFLNLSMLVFKVFSSFCYFHKPEVIFHFRIHFQMSKPNLWILIKTKVWQYVNVCMHSWVFVFQNTLSFKVYIGQTD